MRSLLPDAPPSSSRWDAAQKALDRGDLGRFAEALEAAGLAAASGSQHGELARDLFESAQEPDSPLGARAREQWPRLCDALLDAVAGAADPVLAARYLRGFAMRMRHPAVYTRMLADDPTAARRLVTVLGGSAFLGEAIAARPELGDLCLFDRSAPSAEDAREEVARALTESGGAAAADEEDRLDRAVGALRRAKGRVTARVALADLAGELETREATLVLSALADATLAAALGIAHGGGAQARALGLCVLAMGKLGGREIGYGSDLDVIFLFGAEATADPDAPARYTRLARRVIQLIGMPHAEGRGYELDTRLRPSGSQGLLVSSLGAFARYHEAGAEGARAGERAATWERLALLRARSCAGDRALGEQAEAIARRAAYEREADPGELARDVVRLRERIERELARERPGRHDLKLGRGGLIEIELAVQLLQLLHGRDPRVRTTDTGAAIAALAGVGALAAGDAELLTAAYAFLRRLEQRLRIVHGDGAQLLERGAAGMVALGRRMGHAGADPAERLLEQYLHTTARVRAAWERIVVARTG